MAVLEAGRARHRYDHVIDWLVTSLPPTVTPVAAEIWVFTPDYKKILLVQHPWRCWVPHGGKVEPGEHPRDAAQREVLEETGLLVQPASIPAAAAVRRFKPEWTHTLALSYSATAGQTPCRGEEGQPAAWTDLTTAWATFFPEDSLRLRRYAKRLSGDHPSA